jgi:hypothetical protein
MKNSNNVFLYFSAMTKRRNTNWSINIYAMTEQKSNNITEELCTNINIQRECSRANYRLWYEANKKIIQKKQSEYASKYYEINKAKAAQRYRDNIAKIKIYQKQYQKANRQKFKEQYNERYKNDELFRAKAKLRASVCQAFKRIKQKKVTYTEKLLGCSWQQAKNHLESLFLPGMTWENHGEWHIDHKIPIATADTLEDIAKLCHISNLQPLWAIDNLIKGSTVDLTLLNNT